MSFDNHVIQLNDTKEMPMLGLGVYKATDDGELKQAISSASALGYRLIDTASFYKNEEGVGKAIKSLGLPKKNCLSLPKSGTLPSASAILRTALIAAWKDWGLIMWIYI